MPNNQYPVQPSHLPINQLQPPPQSLAGMCGDSKGRRYELSVEQQPVRARMCGFGDKDRRPITPPPCIRLRVYDATGKEVDFNEVDSTFFVLSVDLWDEHGSREVNLVRHSSGTPTVSISSSTTTSYPPPGPHIPQYMGQPGYAAPQMAPPPTYYHQQAPGAILNYGYPSAGQYLPPPPQMPMSVAPQNGMFTRNLIGSLTVNAFRLTDTEQKSGFWFVLQDLSVRTEGSFRLKMSFVDVGSGMSNNQLNQGHAPVLATCFSEPFQVYSAKKFPGVIESTPLSRTFAAQGIKIPIRKDGPKQLSNQAEYDADD